ncbi:hypothetical protein AB6A40_002339 [Gnathostoma spinigerum]|uniref:tryptophan--tRNA ligase n=1 Tax=Gnathostoma spinigerum TaxID=75299 RepID=A0ABD6EH34_9BILA
MSKRQLTFRPPIFLSPSRSAEKISARLLESQCPQGGSLHPTVFFSGIQPTGVPHIGNYFGFIEPWVKIQASAPSESKMFLSIADYHSLSTGFMPAEKMRMNILTMAASLLACGVDPNRTILFQQSDVSEHANLMFILGSLQTIPALSRLPQYKDKAKSFKKGAVPMNLLIYPVLQAADILLYKGSHVPVGEDQSQHMNLAADIARRFNGICGTDFFPIPQQITGNHARIKSLRDPKKKMSKSDPAELSRISIIDTQTEIKLKCSKALTDFEKVVTYDPVRRPAVGNLLTLYAATKGTKVDEIIEECRDMSKEELKLALANALNEKFGPIREKYEAFMMNDCSEVREILGSGCAEATAIAKENMTNIKTLIGLK